MLLDVQNRYSADQALTATAVSTDIIDHGSDSNVGIGCPMIVMLVVEVALDGTTADETYVAALQSDDNSSFSSATEVSSVTMARDAVAGTKYFLAVPPSSSMEQYSRINYTLGGTTPTGTISAYLLPQEAVQNDAQYASGFSIS